MLLGYCYDVISRGRVGSKAQEHLVVDDVRFDVIMTAATIACDVARKNGQHSRGVFLQANEKPLLRQIEEGQERFLNAIQRVISTHAFPAHNPSETRPMLMHQKRDPAKEALLVSRLGGRVATKAPSGDMASSVRSYYSVPLLALRLPAGGIGTATRTSQACLRYAPEPDCLPKSPRPRPLARVDRATGLAAIGAACYSARTTPDPPISAGKSLSLGSPSFIGSTVSA